MSYGSQIWGQNENYALFKKIENLQKRAMRIISFSRYGASSKPLFKQFKILKLEDHISLYNFLHTHDYSRKLLPTSFHSYFTICTDLHNTDTRRQAGCILISQVNSKRYGRKGRHPYPLCYAYRQMDDCEWEGQGSGR